MAVDPSPRPDSLQELARGAVRTGGADDVLDEEAVHAFVREHLGGCDVTGRSVCLVIPDATRSCPLPLLLDAVHGALVGRASRITAVVALGTHAEMSQEQLARHCGYPVGDVDARFPGMTVLNHQWREPATFVRLGAISSERVEELSGGRLSVGVDVRINRAVVEHDLALVVGPVLPHEVVGFSGGNKYFFPGVSGPEVIDLSHWLGALITSAAIIGTREVTPVRAVIDEAAALIPTETLALCAVTQHGGGGLHALSFGEPRAAWAAAADVTARTHVRYLDAPVQRVLSLIPPKYGDVWTAAKGFYKLEPVVADEGEVILYAPHITEIAAMHPEINTIGYHCRDYFTGQWDRFKDVPWGVLAHSTHLRGAGTWDPVDGERPRVRVTLATSIPEDVVRAANLDHLDPTSVDVAAYEADPGTLVIPDAGEVLHRLR